MLIIPAIDLRAGKCVRLLHGRKDKETVYSDNPLEVAQKWIREGAQRLHIIDLDGAFSGTSQNLVWVKKIKAETDVFVQLGGGLRTKDAITRAIEAGVDRVILGTVIFQDPTLAKAILEEFSNLILVALDVKDENVLVKGWVDQSGLNIDQALKQIEELGVKEIIFTDTSRDGALEGVNVAAVKRVMSKTKLTVWASGGVSTLQDIEKLKAIGCPGCIVGKSLYEGTVLLPQAIALAV